LLDHALMDESMRVLLIGGASHLGKTTVAQLLGRKLGAKVVSTDKLARHPGRPWPQRPFVVPPHVAEHYLTLTHDELIESVLEHRRSMWPTVSELVRKHADDRTLEPLVLEGAALLPELVAVSKLKKVSGVWLTCSDRLQQMRIYTESGYLGADAQAKLMIDKFIERERRFNKILIDSVLALKLPHIVVGEDLTAEHVAQLCLERIGPVGTDPKARRKR
jgi:2-phosphoglycerate kinase